MTDVLGEFLGLLSLAERAADSPHAVQRLLVCLLLGRPLSEAAGRAGVGIGHGNTGWRMRLCGPWKPPPKEISRTWFRFAWQLERF